MGIAAATPATASPADTAAPVRVDASRWTTQGRWVTDTQHRVVVTQGINEGAKSAPYAPDAVGFGEDDAAFLEAQGFTSVRLGVLWAGVEPRPGVYDDAYLARVERTVRILNAHGIASVLDFHQDMVNEKYQGEGWPAWAALDHGMPNIVKTGFPGNYFLNEAVKYSFDSFYDNTKASDGIGVATTTPAPGDMWPSISETCPACRATTCSTSRSRATATRGASRSSVAALLTRDCRPSSRRLSTRSARSTRPPLSGTSRCSSSI